MKSHQTEFTGRDLLRILGAPLLVTVLCAGVMHGAARLGTLPSPRPALDADRAILLHQVDAARRQSADVVLIGDSSCLMDVSGLELSKLLNRSVLNLGTLSYLDLSAYAQLVQEHQKFHQPAVVVLLMHPEGLRRLGSEPYQLAVLNNYLAGRDHSSVSTPASAFNAWAGVDIATGRLLKWIPTPLRGDYGRYYGFTPDLERFMTRNLGSAIDPGREDFKGNAEYRLAPTLEKSSRAFRLAVPRSTRLLVGMTPVPAGFARSGFAEARHQMLGNWAGWLETTAILSSLPPTLPADQFARVTHLKPEAVAAYTASLAEAMRPHLP